MQTVFYVLTKQAGDFLRNANRFFYSILNASGEFCGNLSKIKIDSTNQIYKQNQIKL